MAGLYTGLSRHYREALGEVEGWLLVNRKKLLREDDLEAVHRFRLAMKRLRALRRWLKPDGESKLQGKTWSLLRRSFREAGRIRDVQIHHKLKMRAAGLDVGDVPVPESLWKALRASLKELRPRGIRGYLGGLVDGLPSAGRIRTDLVRHLRRRKRKLRAWQRKLPGVAPLHRIRRELKEFLYLLRPWARAQKNHPVIPALVQALNAKQVILGDWHDQVILLEELTASAVGPALQRRCRRDLAQKEDAALACLGDLKEILAPLLKGSDESDRSD